MKKLASFLLIAAIILAFSACGSGETSPNGEIFGGDSLGALSEKSNPSDNNVSSRENSAIASVNSGGQNPVSDEKPAVISLAAEENAGSLRMLHSNKCFDCSDAVCYTDSGYYHIGIYGESEYMCLLYFDFATLSEIVVCSDSSCKHDNVNCAAVFSWDEFMSCHLFVSGDYLYCLNAQYDQDGLMSSGEVYTADGVEEYVEKRRSSLYRMKLDGTEREKLWQADEGDILETVAFEDESGLWFVTKTPAAEKHEGTGAIYYHSKNRALLKYGFSEKAITERIPLDNHNNIVLNLAGGFGNKFILYGKAYPGGGSVMDNMDILAPGEEVGSIHPDYWDFNNRCELVFFTLDRKTKEMKEFFRRPLSEISYGFDILGDKLYIPRKDNTLFTLNVLTGETQEVNIPKDYEFTGIFGDKLMLLHITPDWSDHAMYFTELDGSGMTKSDLMMKKYDMRDMRIELCAAVGDKALVIYDEDRVPSQYNPDAYSSITPLYALISLDDLFNGRANYEPFATAGGGKTYAG